MDPILLFLSFLLNSLDLSSPFKLSGGVSIELRAVLDSPLDGSSMETLGDESRFPRPGMPGIPGIIDEDEPWRLVVKDNLRARRWKF
jgi:hypothetical protein